MIQPHVFVAMADILNLTCDAWLLPTDSLVRVEHQWLVAHPELRRLAATSASADSVTVFHWPTNPALGP